MNLNGCNNFTWYIGCQVLCAATAEIEFKTSEYSFKKSQTLMCIIYWLLVLTPSVLCLIHEWLTKHYNVEQVRIKQTILI